MAPNPIVPALAVGLVAPLVWRGLHPVPFAYPVPESLAQPPWRAELVGGLLGMASGMAIGLLAWPAIGTGRAKATDRWGAVAAAALVGVFLGWQSVVIVVCVASVVHLVLAGLSRQSRGAAQVPWSASLAFATLYCIVDWSALIRRLGVWGPNAGFVALGFGCLLVLVLSFAARALCRRPAL